MHVAGTQHTIGLEGNIGAAARYNMHVVLTARALTQQLMLCQLKSGLRCSAAYHCILYSINGCQNLSYRHVLLVDQSLRVTMGIKLVPAPVNCFACAG